MCIDRQDKKATRRRQDDYLVDVVHELIKEIKFELQNALSCLEDEDYESIEILSHGLNGASFNCELRYLGNLFNTVKESALRENDSKIRKIIE